MSKGPETLLKERMLRRLRSIPLSWWEKIQQVAIRGTPDILGVVRGKFVALELKSEKGKISELQKYKLGEIREARGLGFIVTADNLEEVLDEISRIADRE